MFGEGEGDKADQVPIRMRVCVAGVDWKEGVGERIEWKEGGGGRRPFTVSPC